MADNELCALCGKRRPTVMISQIDQNGNHITKKICLSCAHKLGMPQIDDFIKKMGIPEEQLEQLSDDVDSMLGEMQDSGKSLGDVLEENSLALNGDEPENTDDDDGEKDAESQKSATGTPNFRDFIKNFGNLFGGLANLAGQPGRPAENQQGNGQANTQKDKTKTEKKDKNESPIKKYKFLSQYGIDLNKKYVDGGIDAIVGRDRELERVIQILNRRQKNNPALIGEPGVGKTAIAEGLAIKIVKKEVPYKLQDKIVVMLDLTAIVAGTQFRGQFESRMKGLIEDVKNAGNIILVIDEVHSIIGAGEAEGSLNAANILKPALSRGEIQLIGTTTLKEYRKYIEKDGALERRFQPVMVEEPTIEDTIAILKGIRGAYEKYHVVKISDEIIEDAVRLSERYISDRFLPDKAIDVLDEAASRANLRNKVFDELREKEFEVKLLEEAISDLEEKINSEQSKPVPVNEEETAEVVEDKQIELFKELAEKKGSLESAKAELEEIDARKYVDVLYDDVARVIETWTGIPMQMISVEEAQRILTLEDSLKTKVIGQDNAVSAVSKAIRRNRSGFRKKFKPSSFIFAGPTGVGKTELVKQLTIELFGSIDSLIRLDMSEYMEKHTVSKLIGSPPGYVGYEEAGQLTEKVRRHPYSVILFDEIEKAHPDVFNMLLQILDDGRLTDSQGRVVNFENTVVIMTTNAYGKNSGVSLGFGSGMSESEMKSDAQTNAENALKKIFRPEFLNRIDEIVVFDSLTGEALNKITRLMLGEIEASCAAKGIKLVVSDSAVSYVSENGYEEEYGARPLRRFIQKHLEDELAEMSLKGELDGAEKIVIDVKDGKLSIEIERG